MGQYLSRKYAPLRVTKGTRIAAGLFDGIDCPMVVVGLLVDEIDQVVARVAGTYTCYILRDVEWYDPAPREPRIPKWNRNDYEWEPSGNHG